MAQHVVPPHTKDVHCRLGHTIIEVRSSSAACFYLVSKIRINSVYYNLARNHTGLHQTNLYCPAHADRCCCFCRCFGEQSLCMGHCMHFHNAQPFECAACMSAAHSAAEGSGQGVLKPCCHSHSPTTPAAQPNRTPLLLLLLLCLLLLLSSTPAAGSNRRTNQPPRDKIKHASSTRNSRPQCLHKFCGSRTETQPRC
jgi:hypothetical protein